MDRRQFTKRTALTLAVAGLGGSAFKCGAEKVTIYVQTISAFLNELGGLLPAQAQFIAKIIAVASEFDAAYRRGDFANATTFFNTLVGNISTLTAGVGVNLSPRIKVALTIVSSAVRLIAVLLQQQGATQPSAVARARAASPDADRAISTIEKLANPSAVDAAFAAAKL